VGVNQKEILKKNIYVLPKEIFNNKVLELKTKGEAK
jgi:hypothetical protein